MKSSVECIPCNISSLIRILKRTNATPLRLEQAVKNYMNRILNFENRQMTPVHLARETKEVITELFGEVDFYQDMKDSSNELLLSMYNELKDEVIRSADPVEINGIDEDMAGTRPFRPEDQPEKGGLPCAARSGHKHKFAFTDLHIDVIQDNIGPKCLNDLKQLNHALPPELWHPRRITHLHPQKSGRLGAIASGVSEQASGHGKLLLPERRFAPQLRTGPESWPFQPELRPHLQ